MKKITTRQAMVCSVVSCFCTARAKGGEEMWLEVTHTHTQADRHPTASSSFSLPLKRFSVRIERQNEGSFSAPSELHKRWVPFFVCFSVAWFSGHISWVEKKKKASTSYFVTVSLSISFFAFNECNPRTPHCPSNVSMLMHNKHSALHMLEPSPQLCQGTQTWKLLWSSQTHKPEMKAKATKNSSQQAQIVCHVQQCKQN